MRCMHMIRAHSDVMVTRDRVRTAQDRIRWCRIARNCLGIYARSCLHCLGLYKMALHSMELPENMGDDAVRHRTMQVNLRHVKYTGRPHGALATSNEPRTIDPR
ncbi:hypothetical protein BHM03_00053584 [Ensete ventricosum]|nr:hypothetical protein BHM03_00053584 [Ensete ventricosum]